MMTRRNNFGTLLNDNIDHKNVVIIIFLSSIHKFIYYIHMLYTYVLAFFILGL